MTAPTPHEALATLVNRATRGDVTAAAQVYDHTIEAAWRVALATTGADEPAREALSAAYGTLFAGQAAPASEEIARGSGYSWVLGHVYVTARDARSLGLAREAAQHRGRRGRPDRGPRRLPARALRPGT